MEILPTMQWRPVISSFLSLSLGLKVVEALTINSVSAITQQTGESTPNVPLETAAEALWDAKDFIPTSLQVLKLAADSVVSANLSLPSLNASSDALIMCNGDTFGFVLNTQSCLEALRSPMIVMDDTTPKTWGPRDTGVQYDHIIPRRYVSQDGTCIIEPLIAPGFASARASDQDLAYGAGTVIHDCVAKIPSQGGIAKDFNPDNSFGVFIAKQAPNVRCYGNVRVMAIVNSCYTILDNMPIDNDPRTFGTGGQIQLPWTQQAADRRCYMTLKGSGTADISSWLSIWAKGVTITNMCAAQGKKGAWTLIGNSGRLYLEVGAINPPMDATY